MEIELNASKGEAAGSVLIHVEKIASDSSEMFQKLKRSSSAPTGLNYLGNSSECFSNSFCAEK